MTWFGTVSAWAALMLGALFGVNAYFQFAKGADGWVYAATALLLIVGAVRTLGKMSGGLRLLAGAWGLAGGVWIAPAVLGSNGSDAGAVGLVLACIPFAGLALAVLHKETKS